MLVSIGNYPVGEVARIGSGREVQVHVHPHDLFSVYGTIAHVVLPLLVAYRAEKASGKDLGVCGATASTNSRRVVRSTPAPREKWRARSC